MEKFLILARAIIPEVEVRPYNARKGYTLYYHGHWCGSIYLIGPWFSLYYGNDEECLNWYHHHDKLVRFFKMVRTNFNRGVYLI